MQAFVKFFRRYFPKARTEISREISELSAVLKHLEKIEKLVLNGRLDDRALKSIYKDMPRLVKLRAGKPATKDGFMNNTNNVLVELNRVIKEIRDRRSGRR